MNEKIKIVKGKTKEYYVHYYDEYDLELNESVDNAYNIEQSTYFDILELEKENNCIKYELIDGQILNMSSPRIEHQEILGEIFFQFKTYFRNKNCKPIIESNLNIYNKSEDEIANLFILDLQVVCDKNMIGEKMINGVPSLIVEILSPSSKTYDKYIKYRKYEQCGVNEYWIVNIENKKVYVYELKDSKYTNPVIYNYIDEDVNSIIFEDLKVILK